MALLVMHLSLASYNAGEYRVNRSVMRYYTRDFWYLSSKRAFPRETTNYVPKFIAAVRISKDPQKYGFTNIEYQAPLEYDTVKLEFPISLKNWQKKWELNIKIFKGSTLATAVNMCLLKKKPLFVFPSGKKKIY